MSVSADSISSGFMALFEGRKDAYGFDVRCWRVGNETWNQVVQRHLYAPEYPIGVYPLVSRHKRIVTDIFPEGLTRQEREWVVKWGCVDIDVASEGHASYDYATTLDAHNAAFNLVQVLNHFGFHAWVERTRSDGRHVWVFADDWTPASWVRRTLMVACGVAQVPTREVNPKSEGFDNPETLGNYVRLPYPAGATTYQVIVDEEDFVWGLEEFVDEALATRADPSLFQGVAALWNPPPPPERVYRTEADLTSAPQDFTPYLRQVLANGPEKDRSSGLFYVAMRAKEHGCTPEQAYLSVLLVDDAWGKFVGRPDREKRLMELVERVYR